MIRLVSAMGLVAATLAGTLALPIEVPYTVSAVGKVIPSQEWMLIRDQDGSIWALLRDNRRGTVSSYDVLRFERGDAVRFHLNGSFGPQAHVAAGDTIGRVYSNETVRQLAAVSGRLAAANSLLALHAAGEKDAVVEEARWRLERAVEQARQHRNVLERLRALRERELIAEQELEEAESRMGLYAADVDIARAQLEAVQSGARPEQLQLAETQARAHREEMVTLSERLDMLTVRSPISGIAVHSLGTDTLLTIRDTSALVIVMPVRWTESQVLEIGQEVTVRLPDVAVETTGRVFRMGDTVHRMNGRQVVLVSVLVQSPPPAVLPGAAARCHVRTSPVRLLEFARRKVNV